MADQISKNSILDSTSGLEAFSYGVMAIIITLLVIDLKVPEHLMVSEPHQFQEAIKELIPNFVAFIFTFINVAIYYVNYHHFLGTVKGVDWKMLWHNNHFLFWLVLTPFTTAFVGRYPTYSPVIMLYSFVLFMCGLSFTLLLRYVFFYSNLMDSSIPYEVKQTEIKRGYIGLGMYAIATLSALISPYLSLAILVFIPLMYFVPNLLQNSNEKKLEA